MSLFFILHCWIHSGYTITHTHTDTHIYVCICMYEYIYGMNIYIYILIPKSEILESKKDATMHNKFDNWNSKIHLYIKTIYKSG